MRVVAFVKFYVADLTVAAATAPATCWNNLVYVENNIGSEDNV